MNDTQWQLLYPALYNDNPSPSTVYADCDKQLQNVMTSMHSVTTKHKHGKCTNTFPLIHKRHMVLGKFTYIPNRQYSPMWIQIKRIINSVNTCDNLSLCKLRQKHYWYTGGWTVVWSVSSSPSEEEQHKFLAREQHFYVTTCLSNFKLYARISRKGGKGCVYISTPKR